MSIYIGNLLVSDIIERTGVEISFEDKMWLKERHCHKTKLKKNTWHCYDLPFLIVCESKELAAEMVDRLKKYDWANCKETLRIRWERKWRAMKYEID